VCRRPSGRECAATALARRARASRTAARDHARATVFSPPQERRAIDIEHDARSRVLADDAAHWSRVLSSGGGTDLELRAEVARLRLDVENLTYNLAIVTGDPQRYWGSA